MKPFVAPIACLHLSTSGKWTMFCQSCRVCTGIFCYLELLLLLLLLLVTLNSKQSVSFVVFHVHCNFAC